MRLAILALAAALAAAPAAALAHAEQKPGSPQDGETLAAPPEVVRLNFSGPIRVTALTLVGPAGEIPLARTDGMKPVTTLEAKPDGTMMAPGPYEIEWRGMSSDGHVMEGTVDFTIAP